MKQWRLNSIAARIAVTIMLAIILGIALELAVSVSMLLEVVGFGVNAAVTPLGRPDTERFTLPANPYWEFTET